MTTEAPAQIAAEPAIDEIELPPATVEPPEPDPDLIQFGGLTARRTTLFPDLAQLAESDKDLANELYAFGGRKWRDRTLAAEQSAKELAYEREQLRQERDWERQCRVIDRMTPEARAERARHVPDFAADLQRWRAGHAPPPPPRPADHIPPEAQRAYGLYERLWDDARVKGLPPSRAAALRAEIENGNDLDDVSLDEALLQVQARIQSALYEQHSTPAPKAQIPPAPTPPKVNTAITPDGPDNNSRVGSGSGGGLTRMTRDEYARLSRAERRERGLTGSGLEAFVARGGFID